MNVGGYACKCMYIYICRHVDVQLYMQSVRALKCPNLRLYISAAMQPISSAYNYSQITVRIMIKL